MGLSAHQSLSVVIIIYFVLALLASIRVCLRHGFRLQNTWIYMIILAVLRLVGSSLQIASEETTTRGLATAARFMSSMGIVPLLLVMLGIILTVKNTILRPDPIHARVWTALYVIQWAAFILGIVASANGSKSLSKATIIIIAVIFAIQAVISLVFLLYLKHFNCSRRLIMSAPISIPFLTIRVLYGVLSTFKATSAFGGSNPNVIAQAFMQYLMEFIVVALFLVVGSSDRILEPPTKKSSIEESGSPPSYAQLNQV